MRRQATEDSAVEIQVSAYLPGSVPGPGRLSSVPLELVTRGAAELVLPEATVRDERDLALLDPDDRGDLLTDPACGGLPSGTAEEHRDARRFGLTNVAYHAQRALRTASELLGAPLPHLVIRIGLHEGPGQRWGGGHYRVAARKYDPPEDGPVGITGEVHLGGGNRFLPTPQGPYFGAPAHNLAIVYHEIGHHLCRHTADFRLNEARPARAQTNKKIALDEGTSDVFTAIMLGTADVYGWHRGTLPFSDRRRRALDPRWTMAEFDGGGADPHADGTIWASACWSARERVVEQGRDGARFDRMLLRGLRALPGRVPGGALDGGPDRDLLKRRRYYGDLLDAMLWADPDLSEPVLSAMAAHGIRPGPSNTTLRDAARAQLAGEHLLAGRLVGTVDGP